MNVKALYIHLMPGFNAFLWVLWYIKLNIVDQLLFCCIIPPFWIWIEMRVGEGHFKVKRGLRGGLSPLTLYSITFVEEVNRSLNARSFHYSVNHRGRVSKAADRYSNTLSNFLVQTSEQFWSCQNVQRCLCSAHNIETLPKAQRTRGLCPAYQINFFRSYHKVFILRILSKPQLQNLSQTSAFWLNLKILTKPSFRILTKTKLHNIKLASAAKY